MQWVPPEDSLPPPPPPPGTPGPSSAGSKGRATERKVEVPRDGKIQALGRVEFPNSRKPPARWLRMNPIEDIPKAAEKAIENSADGEPCVMTDGMQPDEINAAERALEAREKAMRGVVTHALRKWNLPPPSVLISVNGGAQTLDITPKQAAVFRHGLLDAARQASGGGDEDQQKTSAWIFTGGTDSGVMALAGKTMHGDDEGPTIPLIGVASWGVVSQRAYMDPRSVPGADRRGGETSSGSKKYAGSYLYNSKSDPESQKQRAPVAVALEFNHSNFVFVDNGVEGANAFSSETEIRSTFEDFIARGAPAGEGRSLFGLDEDGDKFPPPPMVVLVVGGGPGTYMMVIESLKKKRPVVVLSDSGGAAADIFDFCSNGFLDPKVERKYGNKKKTAEEIAMEYLPEIKALGEVETGVRQAQMLTFFALSRDYADYSSGVEDLSTQILNAILSDCESTGEAVVHAVRWRNAHVIARQLEVSTESDPQGIARAFQNALLGRDRSAIKVLIQYNVDVKYVSLNALVRRGGTEGNAVPYTWGDNTVVHQAWKYVWKKNRDDEGKARNKKRRTASVQPGSGNTEDEIRFNDIEHRSMPTQVRHLPRSPPSMTFHDHPLMTLDAHADC